MFYLDWDIIMIYLNLAINKTSQVTPAVEEIQVRQDLQDLLEDQDLTETPAGTWQELLVLEATVDNRSVNSII